MSTGAVRRFNKKYTNIKPVAEKLKYAVALRYKTKSIALQQYIDSTIKKTFDPVEWNTAIEQRTTLIQKNDEQKSIRKKSRKLEKQVRRHIVNFLDSPKETYEELKEKCVQLVQPATFQYLFNNIKQDQIAFLCEILIESIDVALNKEELLVAIKTSFPADVPLRMGGKWEGRYTKSKILKIFSYYSDSNWKLVIKTLTQLKLHKNKEQQLEQKLYEKLKESVPEQYIDIREFCIWGHNHFGIKITLDGQTYLLDYEGSVEQLAQDLIEEYNDNAKQVIAPTPLAGKLISHILAIPGYKQVTIALSPTDSQTFDITKKGIIGYYRGATELFIDKIQKGLTDGAGVIIGQFTDITTQEGDKWIPIKKIYGAYLHNNEIFGLTADQVKKCCETDAISGNSLKKEKTVVYSNFELR